MGRNFLRFLLVGAFLLPLVAAGFGGWATITLEELPDYMVAKQPTTLAFSIRQHGFEKLSDLSPTIEAHSASLKVSASAMRSREDGRYTANLTLPQAGEWDITIHSGFGPSRVKLLPMTVVETANSARVVLSEADRGRRLFVAKGCVTCHVHREVKQASVEVGPDLTGRQFAADYLKEFLANPAIRSPKGGTLGMPNLNLKQPEIVALSAFLNSGVNQAAR